MNNISKFGDILNSTLDQWRQVEAENEAKTKEIEDLKAKLDQIGKIFGLSGVPKSPAPSVDESKLKGRIQELEAEKSALIQERNSLHEENRTMSRKIHFIRTENAKLDAALKKRSQSGDDVPVVNNVRLNSLKQSKRPALNRSNEEGKL